MTVAEMTNTATLELPKNIAISMLRKAGTGDNLLNTLDALITYNNQEQEEETKEPTEWVNAINIDDVETNTVVDEEVIDF